MLSYISKRMKHFRPSPINHIAKKRSYSSSSSHPKFTNISYEEKEGVALICINRPKRRNAVDAATAVELKEAFEQFDANDALSAAVLSGNGNNFCSGYDLHFLANSEQGEIGDDTLSNGPMGPTHLHLSKPVIAAVEGFAVAGGLELALWCDIRIASRNAVFGVFCRRFGVPLIDGGNVRLPRLIGQSRALDMILTGRPVEADEALLFGLANRVVDPGTALSESIAYAKALSKHPQLCLRNDRDIVYKQWDKPLQESLKMEGSEGSNATIIREAVKGAGKFSSGEGRQGTTLS